MAIKPFALGNVTAVLASDVTNTSTVVVPYPTGQTQASLTGSTNGTVAINNNNVFPQAPSGAGTFAVSFGASNITITNNSGITWTAGSTLIASFGGFSTVDSSAGSSGASVAALTAATGAASDTVADVTGAFSQSILNNNFASVSAKINAILAALKNAGLMS